MRYFSASLRLCGEPLTQVRGLQFFSIPLPARVRRLPARVRRLSARVRRLPARVRRLPARVRRLPARVRRLPARVRRLPALVRRLPALVSSHHIRVRSLIILGLGRGSRSTRTRRRPRKGRIGLVGWNWTRLRIRRFIEERDQIRTVNPERAMPSTEVGRVLSKRLTISIIGNGV